MFLTQNAWNYYYKIKYKIPCWWIIRWFKYRSFDTKHKIQIAIEVWEEGEGHKISTDERLVDTIMLHICSFCWSLLYKPPPGMWGHFHQLLMIIWKFLKGSLPPIPSIKIKKIRFSVKGKKKQPYNPNV